MKVGSLFSGIGGLDLGLERAGMEVIWQSEVDDYASRVLAKHWPNVPNLGDVRAIDWGGVERPDLICGGYPCQPFSQAGRRRGADDPRHLWPEFARALRLVRPEWVLLENVPGHLGLGFADVLADLADLGFDASWEMLPAESFGAPHLRYRLFVVAHAQRVVGDVRGSELLGGWADDTEQAGMGGCATANADESGLQGRVAMVEVWGREPPARRSWWQVEPDVGRVAHGVPDWMDRLRCLGNAVVPQVAEWIGRRIMEAA